MSLSSPLSKPAILAALSAAWALPSTPVRTCGCGRAYVCLSEDRATVNAVSAAAKELGIPFVRKNYGAGGNALYCGYDNADGRALGKAEVVAASLKAAGISCYVDGASD
jgi:hypothetical protein